MAADLPADDREGEERAEDAGREDPSQTVGRGDSGARPEDREHEEGRFAPPALAGRSGLPDAHTFRIGEAFQS